jgi:acetyl esterase/lipase
MMNRRFPTKRVFAGIFIALLLATLSPAQTRHDETAPTQTILLWNDGAPGALGQTDDDQPSITVYRTFDTKTPGTSVIVVPGGGYGFLASNHEGRQMANWFNSMGITAFVLKYRVGPRYHHPIELGDAQRALRLVRSRAREFGIVPDRIGMIGFSAGGHLASTVATHFDGGNPAAVDAIDRVSSRPDFLILAYPIITLAPPFAHSGSAKNLLGENPDPS